MTYLDNTVVDDDDDVDIDYGDDVEEDNHRRGGR